MISFQRYRLDKEEVIISFIFDLIAGNVRGYPRKGDLNRKSPLFLVLILSK